MARLYVLVGVWMMVCAAGAEELSVDVRQKLDQAQALTETLRAQSAVGSMKASASPARVEAYQPETARETANVLSIIQNCVVQQNYDEAIRNLRRLLSRPQTPEIKKAFEALLSTLEKERDARQAQIVGKVDAFIKRAAEVSWKAMKSEDLEVVQFEAQELRNELNRAGNSPLLRRLQTRLSNVDSFLSRWMEYLDALSDNNLRRAMEIQRDLRNGAMYRPIVAFFPEEPWKKRQMDLRNRAMEGFNKAMAEIAPQVAKAKSAQELRQVLASVEELGGMYSSDVIGGEERKLNNYRNSLRQWSNVIGNMEQNNVRQALYALRDFDNESSRESLIAPSAVELVRTKLLREYLTADAPVDRYKAVQDEVSLLISQMKTKADVEKVRNAVARLRSIGLNNDGNTLWLIEADLSQLVKSIDQLEEKRYQSFWSGLIGRQQSHPWEAGMQDFRRKLGVQALTAQFALDLSKTKGSLGEIVDGEIKAAEAKSDWDRVYRLMMIYSRLGDAGVEGMQASNVELSSMRLFLEGRNLEAAGQWSEAVKAYQDAVRKVGEHVPRAAIKAQLDALAKSHPEAWGK